MNNIAVIYTSKYGSTKRYAQWIAEETKADLFESTEIKAKKLMEYDTIIYGGGLYASGIAGISIITKNFEFLKDKKIIVFTVGLASTDRKEVFLPIIEKCFTKEMREHINFYHLRGGIDYNKLGIIHKAMMAMLKTVISKKSSDELSDDDRGILATYGRKVDFTDKNTVGPLLSFLKNNDITIGMMDYKIIIKNKIRYITIPELTQLGLNHCFTTSDMDMGIRTNPSILDIKNNLTLINETLEITPNVLFGGVQTHSKNIVSVLDINQGEENEVGRFFPDADGFVTNIEGVALFTTYADCTPIILFDPVKKVHGNVHSGWKGTLQKIGQEAVNKMVQDYNCNLEDIIAIIGPSIGKDDFEVESDVMQQFQDEFDFHDQIIRKKDDIKYLIDIQETNKRILLESGIQEKNITVVDLSTKSNPMLHSYRRDGNEFGLMGCITCL